MSFRQLVYLRIGLTIAAAAALTSFAFNLAANAQATPRDTPLFVLTDQEIYAVYSLEEWHVALKLPDRPLNMWLSPDGAALLVDTYSSVESSGREFYVVDTATLEIRQLLLAEEGAEIVGTPVWRWDGGALLYTEARGGVEASAIEYVLATGERVVRGDDLPLGTNLRGSGLPQVIFWSPEAFALLQYDRDINTNLLRYDSSGTALPTILLHESGNPENDDHFDNITTVVTERGMALAVRRPEIGQWDVIDVLSGEVTRLDEGLEVVQAPARVSSPHLVMTIQQDTLYPAIYNLAVLINGQRGVFLDQPKSVLTISPDGEYYAVADADGFAVSDGDVRISLDLPQDDWMLTWRVAWAPLEGRIESIGRFRLDSADGRFRQGSDGLLVLLDTPTGELPVATTTDVRLAPDGESIVWVSRGVNNEAQVMRYDWQTNETTYLFSGEYTEAMPPLPVIVEYDGAVVTLNSEEGRFTVDLDGSLTRADGEQPAQTPEAALDTVD